MRSAISIALAAVSACDTYSDLGAAIENVVPAEWEQTRSDPVRVEGSGLYLGLRAGPAGGAVKAGFRVDVGPFPAEQVEWLNNDALRFWPSPDIPPGRDRLSVTTPNGALAYESVRVRPAESVTADGAVPGDPAAGDPAGDPATGDPSAGDSGCIDLDLDGWCAATDCDDSNAWTYPGAPEVMGDLENNDCDSSTDEWDPLPDACPSPCLDACGGRQCNGDTCYCKHYPCFDDAQCTFEILGEYDHFCRDGCCTQECP